MGEEKDNCFLNEIVKKCHINLLQKSSKLALAYLVSRGITLGDIKNYNIGYISNFLENIENKTDDANNFNKWLGYRGRFVSKRIVFPIYDEVGTIKGIETRALDQKSMDVLDKKYLPLVKDANLHINDVRYKKFYLDKSKYTACFFGLPSALESIWKERSVFLTEGIFDCLSILKIYPNCLSSLTANINKYQIMWLKRYVKRVILIFDMDKKGQDSIERIKDILGDDLSVYSVQLKNKDINETVIKNGAKELKLIIDDKLTRFF